MMTYNQYQRYIHSRKWKKKVERAKAAADWRCMLCYSDGNLQGHHRTYERLGHEKLTDITILCDVCHGLFHRYLPEFSARETAAV